MKKLLSVLQLFPFCFASTHPYAWTQVCETEPSWEGRGSLSVRGDIVRQFTDETGILNIIMDNQERNIEVKCKSSLGDPRISQDGMDITSNWPGTSSSERPEGQSRPSVNLTLWKQNFTTFWKVDKLIKCNAGTERECSARVIEVKDGNWVKGNCTVLGQGTAGKPEIMNCNIRDWVENAMRAKGNSACFNKGDFNGAAEYQYSFRKPQDMHKWTTRIGTRTQETRTCMRKNKYSVQKQKQKTCVPLHDSMSDKNTYREEPVQDTKKRRK